MEKFIESMKLFIVTFALSQFLHASSLELPDTHMKISLDGWSIIIDRRLKMNEYKERNDKVFKLLKHKLFDLTLTLPPKKINQLKTFNIWIDVDHELNNMQYHPGVEWLKKHGYHPALHKCVHIPKVDHFIKEVYSIRQPWFLLHELAHAYHHQVLGFNHPEILEQYNKSKAEGKLKEVVHIFGKNLKHYALMNPQEYFAEMTEAYFARNDFYPFVRGELKQFDEGAYNLIKKVWSE